jgi:hypothetical protein
MGDQRQIVTLTREELYQRVWTTAIHTLATEFGITGTGLAKICRRMQVPVPPRGYWNKLQAGKPVAKYRLPPAQVDTQLEVTIQPTPPKPVPSAPLAIPEAVEAEIAAETAKIKAVRVPVTLTQAHPLIRKWIDEDRQRERENRRSKWPMPHDPIDGTEVQKRRLRILSALFAEWERLGHRVKSEGYSYHHAYLEIEGRKIEFALFEYERQRRRPLTQEEKYDSLYQHNKWRQVKEPTGQLVFRIKSHVGTGARIDWRDQQNQPLEKQIGDILERLIAAPALLKEEDARRREAERRQWEEQQKHAEQERLRRLDASRWRHFLDLAAAAEQARNARLFLDELEKKCGIEGADNASNELWQWLRWAREKAERIDPLSRSPDDLLRENQAVTEWTYR